MSFLQIKIYHYADTDMKNSSDVFIIWNHYISSFCTPILAVNTLIFFFLSLIWCLYLMIQIIEDHKVLKSTKKSQSKMREQEFRNIIKNAQIRRVRNTFFPAICISECILCISLVLENVAKHKAHKDHFHQSRLSHWFHMFYFGFKHEFFHLLNSIFMRVAAMLISTSFYSVLTFIRLLTEFLCSNYDYFDANPYIRAKLLLSFGLIPILIILGLFRQLILFFGIIITFAILMQFILFLIASRKLRKLLFKRLFDAHNFESHPQYVINYFKRSLLNYKYASIILMVYLLLQLIGYTVHLSLSFIITFVYLPRQWLDYILYGPKSSIPRYYPRIDAYDHIATDSIQILLTLGTTIQVVPYLLVSIKLVISNFRKKFGNVQRYYDKVLIEKLIAKNNNSYMRNNSDYELFQ